MINDEMAAMVGSTLLRLIKEYICTGSVLKSGPEIKRETVKSPKETKKEKSNELVIPGLMRGKVIL